MTMTQTHGYWTNDGKISIIFDDYSDLNTYSGIDGDFYIRMPFGEDLEEEGFSFPHFIAEGTMKNNEPTFTDITFTSDDLMPLEEAGSWRVRNPDIDLLEVLEKLERKAND